MAKVTTEFLKLAEKVSLELAQAVNEGGVTKGFILIAHDSSLQDLLEVANCKRAIAGTVPMLVTLMKALVTDEKFMEFAKDEMMEIKLEILRKM